LENNYFTKMCRGSEAGPYLRRIDFVYHSTLGLRVIQKKKGEKNFTWWTARGSPPCKYAGNVTKLAGDKPSKWRQLED